MRRWLILLIVTVAGVSIFFFFLDNLYREQINQENAQYLSQVAERAGQDLSKAIHDRIVAVDDLRAFMLASEQLPDFETFDRFAVELLKNYPAIRAVQYVDTDRTIRHIYPLEDNESALDLDLMTRPAVPFVETAIIERRTTINNPTVTVQGVLSIVARVPLYRDDQFLGLVQGVFDIDVILDDIIDSLGDEFDVQLYDAEGSLFWGSDAQGSVGDEVIVPVGDNTWTLAIDWRGSPPAPDTFALGLFWGSGGLVLISLFFVVNRAWGGISGGERIVSLIFIMMVSLALIIGIMLVFLYRVSLDQQRQRLIEIAQGQARLIEAMGRFDEEHSADFPGGPFNATLNQLIEAHENFAGLGRTGEFILAKLEDGQIIFLLHQRHGDVRDPAPIPIDSYLGEPMRRALSRRSGTMIGLDYRGETVLAAYESVNLDVDFHLGIVAKIDLVEIQRPFIQAGGLVIGIALVLVILSAILFWNISSPMIRELEESERRFRRAVMDAPFPIMMHAEDGEVLLISETWVELTGYSHEEISTIAKWTQRAYGQESRLVQKDTDRLYELNGKVHEGEFSITTKSGDQRIWDFSSSPLGRLPNGRRLVLSMAMDVSDRKRDEIAIRSLNEELEQRVAERTVQLEARTRELETFTYSVSHDLKAPLRGIDGYSRLLLEDYLDRLDDEGRTFLRNVRRATEQMNQLIDDLLVYSRLERRKLSAEHVNPEALIQSLIAEYADDARIRGVSITIDVANIVVAADSEGLAMALRNLIDNAFKFTRETAHPVVEIGGHETETSCILWVRDNGVGFDMQYHDRIFEIFQRLHRAEDYAGTGVGLAIVQKTMERIRGRVWAESELGKGATFYLEIPK